MSTIRAIGVPRSGTNLVKYLVETNTELRCVFNHGWWKHGVVPPLFESADARIDTCPTVVMFRDPVLQALAFHRLSSGGAKAMSGASPLRTFIRSPVVMNPQRGFLYRYSNPVDYWEQFYWSALYWEHPHKHFLSLEAIRRDPEVLAALLQRVGADRASFRRFVLPEGYLGRNGDEHASVAFAFERETTLAQRDTELRQLAGTLDNTDLEMILTDQVRAIYARLKEIEFRP